MSELLDVKTNEKSEHSEKNKEAQCLPNEDKSKQPDSFKGKIIRDPLHDLIEVNCPYALDLINSKSMQRLRKVRQLGLAYQVYPGAEHSRFSHSLGVYHIANLAIIQLKKDSDISDKLCRAITLAALLHDIGHGAFSHLFENISKCFVESENANHENWTLEIIKKDEEVSGILDAAGVKNDVIEIINHTFKPLFAVELISSQLDVDRFDYLLRDSFMTGAKYGHFDLPWILRNLTIKDYKNNKQLAIDGRRGLSSVEDYILGRHYMYKHVYYHKTIRAAEKMLAAIIKRAVELTAENKLDSPHEVLKAFANKQPPKLNDYLSLNDFVVLSWIENWALYSTDSILQDLCDKFVRREIFGTIIVPKEIKGNEYSKLEKKLQDFIESKKLELEYYLLQDDADDMAFKNYYYFLEKDREEDSEHQEIYYTDEKGTIKELSGSDTLVMEAKSALKFSEERWYIPKNLITEAKGTLGIA